MERFQQRQRTRRVGVALRGAPRRTIAMLALAHCALGCAPLLRPHNHRQLTWQGASAVMELFRPQRGYAELWIRLDEPARDLRVRMPDGRWLRTAGLEPATVAPYADPLLGETSASGGRRLVVPFEREGCTSALGFVAGSLVFHFEADRLVVIQLTGAVEFPAHCRPGLGRGDGTAAYVMPLSEAQLVELLGPYRRREDYYGGM